MLVARSLFLLNPALYCRVSTPYSLLRRRSRDALSLTLKLDLGRRFVS